MMGRKQRLINAAEYDVLYGRKYYCYLINRHGYMVGWAKRKMNRRLRQENKERTNEEVIDSCS